MKYICLKAKLHKKRFNAMHNLEKKIILKKPIFRSKT